MPSTLVYYLYLLYYTMYIFNLLINNVLEYANVKDNDLACKPDGLGSITMRRR